MVPVIRLANKVSYRRAASVAARNWRNIDVIKLAFPIRRQWRDSMRWQFSLRGMFVVTGIVAACLAAGYYFPTAILVLLLLGLTQAAIVFAGDWLVRPTNRRPLAIVVALSWLLFGSTFTLIGVFQLYRCIRGNVADWLWMASLSFLAVGMYSCYLAYMRWKSAERSAAKPTQTGRRNEG
jgi:hypothetical protein